MKQRQKNNNPKTEKKKKKKNGSTTAGSGNLQNNCLSFFLKKKIIIIIIESRVLNLDLLHQMKNKAKDLQAYWVILTEKVQVTYLKIFFLFFLKRKPKKMKSCNNSVVDTSGHKQKECIVWTESNITIRAKN